VEGEIRVKLALTPTVGLVLAASVPSIAATVGDPAASLGAEAREHYEAGRYEAALQAYRQALLHDPGRAELKHNEGGALYRLEDYQGSLEAFGLASQAADAGVAASSLYNLGNSHFQLQEYEAAADAYTRALALEPEDLDARANLELALRRLEEQQQPQQQSGGGEPPDQEDGKEQQEPQPGESPQPQEGEESAASPQEEESADQQEEAQPEGQEAGEEQRAEPQEDQMSPEEAARLLDALAERDREAQRRRYRVAGPAGQRKDW
jgi:Ca-activated chloride channel family protein